MSGEYDNTYVFEAMKYLHQNRFLQARRGIDNYCMNTELAEVSNPVLPLLHQHPQLVRTTVRDVDPVRYESILTFWNKHFASLVRCP